LKISPKYSVNDYSQLNFEIEADWQKAIDILEDRIYCRFLKPVDKVEDYEFSGFAIMAIDCLLIETLQQFRNGVPETPRYKNEEYFVKFLTETSFQSYFDKELATIFYKHIRNGILHQAETKEGTKIRITPSLPLVDRDGKNLIINRKKFHKHLVQVFDNYINDLRDKSNLELRDNFKKKMNHICRL
jgi:hypothetical protein